MAKTKKYTDEQMRDYGYDKDYSAQGTISRSTYDDYRGEMDKNAAAWHTADEAGRQSLHARNAELAEMLGQTYDSRTGQWTGGYAIADEPQRNYSSGRTDYSLPSYSYNTPTPTFEDSYSKQIDQWLNNILNRDAFSYDYKTDPLYAQYAQTYGREGERARQNTLADASAQTGGLASSYALQAGQQAQNYYAAQTADKIPELHQMAYDMYLTDIDNQVRDLGLLQNMSDTQYGRYRDTMGDWKDDRSFAYNYYRDQVGDVKDDRAWDYGLSRDAAGDARYDDETAYNRQQDALQWAYTNDQTAYDRALTNWQLTGSLDANGAKVLGLPEGTMTSDYQYQLAQAAKSGGGYGGGGGGNTQSTMQQQLNYEQILAGLTKSSDPYGHMSKVISSMGEQYYIDLIGEDLYNDLVADVKKGRSSAGSGGGGSIEDLFEAMYRSGTPYSYLSAHAKDYGMSTSALEDVQGEYTEWLERRGSGAKMTYLDVLNKSGEMLSSGDSPSNIGDFLAEQVARGNISNDQAMNIINQFGLGG